MVVKVDLPLIIKNGGFVHMIPILFGLKPKNTVEANWGQGPGAHSSDCLAPDHPK